MKRPKIKITLIDQKGEKGFPYIDILRYGGSVPGNEPGTAVFCCPDADTINVFKIEIYE